MSGEFITPAVLAEHLGVSERILRRLADAYSQVYGPLPRVSPTGCQRLFPLMAVERIRAAHQLMSDVPGMRAADAFKALRDGVTFPSHLAASPNHNHLAPVMAELHILHAELANLRGEVAGLRALVEFVAERHGRIPQSLDELDPDETGDSAVGWLPPTPRPTVSTWPAGLQPSLTRLLSDLESGYSLLEVRGEVVLLTPSGQQIRLVDPRMIAALVKQGWLVRDGSGLHLNSRTPSTPLPVQES